AGPPTARLARAGLRPARSGYVQSVTPEPLVEAAVRHDLVIVLAKQVGDHVVAGTPIAWAWRRAGGRPPPGAGSLREVVADAIQVGFERTMVQDVGFGIRRLGDIDHTQPATGVRA